MSKQLDVRGAPGMFACMLELLTADLEMLCVQVGIVTLQTAREVAAESGISEADIEHDDERVGAVVITGQQIR